jgi:NAD(P)-dependent dehydrogenase (short-subunit alcohol dehydrogenase family)
MGSMSGIQTGRLANRVAAITGGASGIGKATALRFLNEGAFVVAADLNSSTGAAFLTAAEEAGYGPDRVRFAVTNVAVEDDIMAMVDLAVSSFGRLDVMFNNAGIGGAFGPITEVHVEDWDETFHVLARGVFLGVKHAARQMIAQGDGGSIVNTASVAGITGGGGPAPYSAAKAAVVNFTRAVSTELAQHRIRINAICPGAIQTPLLAQGRGKDALKNLPQMQPWPEAGQPEDIAAAALFLASDDARFMTGESILVDGGLFAAGPSAQSTRPLADSAPIGLVGMNRGTTGQKPTIRNR